MIQIVAMITMMAANCSSTRSRISFCEVLASRAHHVEEAEQQHDATGPMAIGTM